MVTVAVVGLRLVVHVAGTAGIWERKKHTNEAEPHVSMLHDSPQQLYTITKHVFLTNERLERFQINKKNS